MNYSNNVTRLLLILICAASSLQANMYQIVKDKYALVSSAVKNNIGLTLGCCSAAVYGAYKKVPAVQTSVNTIKNSTKSAIQAICAPYNTPVTVGFLSKLAACIAGGYYVQTHDTTRIQEKARRIYQTASQNAQAAQAVFQTYSTQKQVGLGLGIFAAVSATGILGKKLYTYMHKTTYAQALINFKKSLSAKLIEKYTSVLDALTKNYQILFTAEARAFLAELDRSQYGLAECLVDSGSQESAPFA
jgi:hypothetical protein